MTTIKDYLEQLATEAVEARDRAYSEYKDYDDAEEAYLNEIENIVLEAYDNIKDVLMRGLGE